jgi:hypothetical protein
VHPQAVERVRQPAPLTEIVVERTVGPFVVVPVVGGATESSRVAVAHRDRV